MEDSTSSGGFTESERYLQSLARETFLSLWSFPNVYRDQGKKDSGDGKEVCDLLVVFGRDVLIFSDKHIELKSVPSIEIGWSRWVRAAVIGGARQIFGAERWLKNGANRLFLDRTCTQPFPIALPSAEDMRIHRIVVVRGAATKCRELLGGSGSLMVNNGPLDETTTFDIGQPFPEKGFVHVIDEAALDTLLKQLDTVTDFVDYLVRKEAFLTSGIFVAAAGEEELLAMYVRTLGPDDEHDFVRPENANYVMLDEGLWEEFTESRQYSAQQKANQVSYCWDALAEKFNHHILTGTQHYSTGGGVSESEQIMRCMAREPRVRRRMLVSKLLSMIESTDRGMKRATLFQPSDPGDPYWVFLVLPEPEYASYEQYREVRHEMLSSYCWVIRHLFPSATDVVGIATNAGGDGRMTEDAMYFDARDWNWNDDIAEQARRFHEEFGFFKVVERREGTTYEFPLSAE